MVFLSEVIGWTVRDEGSAPCSIADSMHDLFSAVMHTHSSIQIDNLPVQLQATHGVQGTLKGTSSCCCCPNHEEQAWIQDLSLQMGSQIFLRQTRISAFEGSCPEINSSLWKECSIWRNGESCLGFLHVDCFIWTSSDSSWSNTDPTNMQFISHARDNERWVVNWN